MLVQPQLLCGSADYYLLTVGPDVKQRIYKYIFYNITVDVNDFWVKSRKIEAKGGEISLKSQFLTLFISSSLSFLQVAVSLRLHSLFILGSSVPHGL